MKEITFYEFNKTSLESGLFKLLEKIYSTGEKVVINFTDEEELDLYNKLLWTQGRISFLPHASFKDKHPELHPIFLTLKDENPIEAKHQVSFAKDLSNYNYPKTIIVYNGNIEQEKKEAIKKFNNFIEQSLNVKVYCENKNGNWESKVKIE